MVPFQHKIICIVGPTASGKSDLAQEIALALDGEIVSADSMQIYRGMDIGTGKVTSDQQRVSHFGIDLVDPGIPYSAALYQEYARSAFSAISNKGKRIVLVGGTGLYIRAAIDDYSFPNGDNVCNPVRDKYEKYAEEQGAQALWNLLNEQDPLSAQVIHPHNVRRVVRAFELIEEGESYARQKARLQFIPQLYPATFIGLKVEPEVLRERINQRVDGMNRGFREGLTASQAIGYKEIVAALDGNCSMADAVEEIKTSSRRYAKRQRTWFGKDKRISWINAESGMRQMLGESLMLIEQADLS